MRRPAGVILTTVVLGLCAALQLISAVGMGFAAFAVRNLPPAPQPVMPGYPPIGSPPAQLVTIFLILYTVFLAALATWAIITLIGLLRLKNWARYSVLVIGGCIVALSLMMIFGAVVAATMMPMMTASAAKLPAHTMQVVFLFEGIIFAIFGGIGIWWLVYFNLRSTKAVFRPEFSAASAPAYGLDHAIFPAPPGTPPPPLYAVPAVYAPAGRFSNVPIPVVVIACLSLLGGVITIPYVFLPFPGFIAGFILSPVASRVFYLAAGLTALGLGVGLLQLNNWARIVMNVLLAFGVVNLAVLVTPWGRSRMMAFSAQMYGQMHMPGMADMASIVYTGPLMYFSAAFGLAVYGAVAWILYRYRGAFARAAGTVEPAPPSAA